jgi:serine/threonine-protein kinase
VATLSLGSGGSAEVYEALHVGLRKTVVVKVMRPEHVGNARVVERMRFEAQALAQIAHPNITAVTDCGLTPDGRPFFVMERLEGHTLHVELEQRGWLPVAEVVVLARQLCAGLSAAHALGIVHRDIKLKNLFLADPGGTRTLKVLDFGIAKLMPEANPSRTPHPLAIKSEEGMTIGTPRFLAPEQVMCGRVDARTDIYACGLVLFRLLVGRDPFSHHTDLVSLFEAHVSEIPRPPSQLAPQPIAPAIDDAILCALAKDPANRYASAAQFAVALERALAFSNAKTPTPQSEGAPRGPVVGHDPAVTPPDQAPPSGDGSDLAATVPRRSPLAGLAATLPLAAPGRLPNAPAPIYPAAATLAGTWRLSAAPTAPTQQAPTNPPPRAGHAPAVAAVTTILMLGLAVALAWWWCRAYPTRPEAATTSVGGASAATLSSVPLPATAALSASVTRQLRVQPEPDVAPTFPSSAGSAPQPGRAPSATSLAPQRPDPGHDLHEAGRKVLP